MNVTSLFLGVLVAHLMIGVLNRFCVYLLDDRHGITDERAAKVLGNMGTTADVLALTTALMLGSLMDLFGRKIPSIAGLMVASIGILLSPVPQNLPGLYICRILSNVGCLPFMWSPYSVDYIKEETLGLYSAYITVLSHIAAIMSGSGAI